MKNIFILLLSLLSVTSYAQLDRSVRPKPGPTPEIKMKNPTEISMPNGLKLYVVEDHKIPKVSMLTIFDFEDPLEGKAAGLSSLVGDVIKSGTQSHSKTEINDIIDGLGATLAFDNNSIYASSLTRHFGEVMEMCGDIMLNTKPDPKELDLLKKQLISALETQKDDPDAQLQNAAAVANYGTKNPYGEVPTPETVANITLEDCIGFKNLYFRPNIAYMAIVGDITPDQAKALVKQHLANWQKADVPKSTYGLKGKPQDKQVIFVPKTGAVQSNFAITYPVAFKHNSPDRLGVSVMNYILGGGSSSKLFTNLRETHGWTYGAYSGISPDELMSDFSAGAKCRNEVTDSAVTETLAEMENMKSGNFTDEDVTAAINNLGGSFSRSLEQPRNIALYSINKKRYNLPDDYYSNYLINLKKIDKAKVKSIANKYLSTDKYYLVVSGNQDQTLETLKKFDTDGEIELRNHLGGEVEQAAQANADMTAEQVVADYIDATGGAQIWQGVKDIYTKSEGEIQGTTLTSEQWRSKDKLKNLITVMGMTVQEIVYNQGKGYSKDQTGAKNRLTADELAEYKAAANYQLDLNYDKEGYKLKLEGTEKLDGKDAYKITLTPPQGDSYTEYYDMKTHYKLATVTSGTQQGMSMTQTVTYGDYKETAGGVVMPFETTITISAGEQSQIIKTKVVDVKVNEGIDDRVFAL